MDMFRQVHAVDGHPKLFLNDYGIVVNANKAVVGINCTFKLFHWWMFKLLHSLPHLFVRRRCYNHIFTTELKTVWILNSRLLPETSWSESILFSKQDISRFSVVRVKCIVCNAHILVLWEYWIQKESRIPLETGGLLHFPLLFMNRPN